MRPNTRTASRRPHGSAYSVHQSAKQLQGLQNHLNERPELAGTIEILVQGWNLYNPLLLERTPLRLPNLQKLIGADFERLSFDSDAFYSLAEAAGHSLRTLRGVSVPMDERFIAACQHLRVLTSLHLLVVSRPCLPLLRHKIIPTPMCVFCPLCRDHTSVWLV